MALPRQVDEGLLLGATVLESPGTQCLPGVIITAQMLSHLPERAGERQGLLMGGRDQMSNLPWSLAHQGRPHSHQRTPLISVNLKLRSSGFYLSFA